MLIDEVRHFLGLYFEVLQTQDLTLFDEVFHTSCVLYSQKHNDLVVLPHDAYREIIQRRRSAASDGYPRDEQVLMIDFLSPTMAMAKLRLRLFDAVVDDHLNLMKHDGKWKVYSKYYSKVGNA